MPWQTERARWQAHEGLARWGPGHRLPSPAAGQPHACLPRSWPVVAEAGSASSSDRGWGPSGCPTPSTGFQAGDTTGEWSVVTPPRGSPFPARSTCGLRWPARHWCRSPASLVRGHPAPFSFTVAPRQPPVPGGLCWAALPSLLSQLSPGAEGPPRPSGPSVATIPSLPGRPPWLRLPTPVTARHVPSGPPLTRGARKSL